MLQSAAGLCQAKNCLVCSCNGRCVDLLKVNVERAELDVLRGVSKEDWPRVQQVSVQVHDIGGRVAAINELLNSVGFERVTVYKEPRFRGCCLYMVYASRCREAGR
jgi:31-O-methyltransferase